MKRILYIFLSILRWTSGRTHRTHRTHKKHSSKPHRGADKPPPREKSIILNRNAKFAPCFSRGEFGVFRHAHFELDHISGVGCRDPPVK